VELRQLRYFLTLSEELNFGKAAKRLRIAGPSLSQQIKALERDLGLPLFDRDHHSVALTMAGSTLLPHVRELIENADELRRLAVRISGGEHLRFGYVNWLPPELGDRLSTVSRLHLDTWVAPSHTQAAGSRRVHSTSRCAGSRSKTSNVSASIRGSLAPTASTPSRRATTTVGCGHATRVCSWTRTRPPGPRGTPTHNILPTPPERSRCTSPTGGITGAAYFDHVRRLRRPVINSPKGQADRLPPDLVSREVIDPAIYWTWSLIWRRSEQRPAVRAAVDTFAEATNIRPLLAEGAWVPDTDPHRVNPRTAAP